MKIFQKLTAFVTALSLVAVNQSVLLNTQAAIPFSLSCANDEIFTTDDSDMTFTVSNAYARNGDDWDIVLMSDTDEVLAKMEYVDYYTFTCHIDIDNSKAGVLSFYAKDTISDIKTPTIDIIIFDEFTEEDIAKMQEVDNAIAELKQTEDYKNADYDGKLELISTLLQELQEKGLVKSYGGPSFDSLKIEFQYHNGKSGVAADLDELYTPEPMPTNPTPPEPMPTNPTPTEPEPMPTNPTPTEPEPTTEINYNQVYFYDIWQYKLNDTGITITACDRDVTGEITVPNEIDGKTVTAIGEHTFYGCTRISGITLPDTVQEIGKQAFYQCMSLESVNVPAGVPAIEDETFLMCRELKAIELPSSVTSIGVRAFTECQNLIKVQLPEDVASIGEEAFMQCSSLEEINIPHPVTEIAENTFLGCTSLKKMTLFQNVHKIGKCAFLLCNLETLLIDDYNCEIDESFATMSGSRDTVFIGYTGSTTQEFAETYGYAFQPLETKPQPDPTTEPTTEPKKFIYGDLDGDNEVGISDVVFATRAALGKESLTPEQEACADVDWCGHVTPNDALLIMQKVVNLIDYFPVELDDVDYFPDDN